MRPRWILTALALFLIIGSVVFFAIELIQRSQRNNSPNIATESNVLLRQPSEIPLPTPTTSLTLLPPPESKILPGGTHTFQTFNNCGPASLSMALSYYGIGATQLQLGSELRPFQNPQGNNDDKSVTLAELAGRGQEYGFIAYHRPAGDSEMVKLFIAYDILVITRTWLKPGEDIGHYRVIKGYDQTTGEFIQDDSLQGKDLRYSYQRYNELWEAFNYEFLVFVPEDKKAIAEAILGDKLDPQNAWQLALTQADTQLQTNPNNIYAGFNRSVALYHLGRDQESIAAYEQVANKLPSRMLWYQIEPLLAYYQLGDTDRVMSMSQQILTNQNRAFSELQYLRGMIFRKNNQETQAQEAFSAAQRYNTTPYWKLNLERIEDV